jgi:predicted alpha/beta superfamily hydrolase
LSINCNIKTTYKTYKLNKTITSLVFLFFANLLIAQNKIEINKKTPFTIGESIEFKSEILNENRLINVYLPNSYKSDSISKYHVIYLLDGSTDEDFIHVAGLVQFGSFSWIGMIPETIVIGIANKDRKHDYTYPTKNEADKKEFPTTGASENFIDFIESELQPLINSTYRTTATKTIIGQSLGGLLATEILLKKPELFDNYIIISPSLWWDDESLLKYKPTDLSGVKSIYIGVGKEGKIMEKGANSLYEKLKPIANSNTKLFFKYFENQNHGDALHLGVYDSFEKIFKKR